MSPVYEPSEAFAARLDERDPLARFRERFAIPRRQDGTPVVYFNGNSLGLMPLAARDLVAQELDDWADLAGRAHFEGKTPWFSYHEVLREPAARLVGAHPAEVVVMNGLTVNLHLMMATFYRPEGRRHRILIEDGAFPSDAYAVQSQLVLHALDPERALIRCAPDRVLESLDRHGDEIALVLLPGVQYYSGQLFDIATITEAAHRKGCVIGWDLAHAAGNVPSSLHDWNVDFAAWCSYKYLNAGPGAPAGCFVHARHAGDVSLPRLGGWWGNDPATRFRMHEQRAFVPRASADGWQLSNPPILAMAPLRASLAIFDEVGMDALRHKSVVMTGYLEWLLDRVPDRRFEIITPRSAGERGCQLSLRVLDRPKETLAAMEASGLVADYRPPDVVRVAPVPLYNTFHEIWQFAQFLREAGRAG